MPLTRNGSGRRQSNPSTQLKNGSSNGSSFPNTNTEIISFMQEQFDLQKLAMQEQLDRQLSELKNIYEATIKKQQADICQLKSDLCKLKDENSDMQVRLDNVEQQQLSNMLILSGPCVSDALSRAPEDIQPRDKVLWAANNIIKNRLKLDRHESTALSAKMLGNMPNTIGATDKRPILLTVGDQGMKKNLFRQVLKLKSKDIYLNEFLTARRKTMLKSLLEIRKTNKGKYLQVFTVNGVIHVKFEKDGFPKKIYNEEGIEGVINHILDK